MALTAGTMITENVRLAQVLPGAGSDSIWLADQLDWRKKVVVKLLTEKLKTDDDAIVEFLEHYAPYQEIETTHAVLAFDYGLTDDFVPFVVMEQLTGQTIAQHLRKEDRLSPQDSAEVIAQVAEAIDKAHAESLLHLGLGPDNVFLCKASKGVDAKVLNFGVASFTMRDRKSEYAAPEQYLSQSTDHRSDLWSLGALAYLVLTGQHAIDGHKRRLMQWDFEPPSELWLDDVPPEVDDWFTQALHKDPDKRYSSGEQMAIEFQKAMHLLKDRPAEGAGIGKVIEVGTPSTAPKKRDVVLQEGQEDSPDIVIDVDE
jgi:serine/threonine protein kinase